MLNALLHPSRGLQIVWILLLCAAVWSAPVWRGGFSYDDREAIVGNPVVEGQLPWTSALDRDYWHHRGDAGQWRPLATLALRADRQLWGLQSRGYHVTNLLLHLAVVALLAALLQSEQSLAANRWCWFGVAFFAVHPALADSVAWISGRTSMLSALGGLLGAWGLVRFSGRSVAASAACSCAGLLLALAGKEDGLAFAPLYVLLAWRRGRRAASAAILGVCVGLALWMLARTHALGAPLPSAPGAPLVGVELLERARIGAFALIEGLRLAVLPLDYGSGYRPQDLEGPRSVALLMWCAILCASLCAVRAILRGHTQTDGSAFVRGSFALALLTALVPWTQIIPAGEVFAPRFLYLPLLFASPLIGEIWLLLWRRRDRALVAGALVMACSLPLCWKHARPYASRTAFWQARLERFGPDARVYNALGNAHLEELQPQAARLAWEHAIELDPEYSRPWTNLGSLFRTQGETEAARRHLRQACKAGPRNPIAFANLASLELAAGNSAQARGLYERATELAPGMGALWRGLGRAHLGQGERAAARLALDRALQLDPGDKRSRALRAGLD